MLKRVMACGTPAYDDKVEQIPLQLEYLQCNVTCGAAVAMHLHRRRSDWLGLGSLSIVLESAGSQRLSIRHPSEGPS